VSRVHDDSVTSRSRTWGEMRLTMIERADELIARDMPGYRLPPGVRIELEFSWRGPIVQTATRLRFPERMSVMRKCVVTAAAVVLSSFGVAWAQQPGAVPQLEVRSEAAPADLKGDDSKVSYCLGLSQGRQLKNLEITLSQKDFLKDHRRDLRDFLKNVVQTRDQAFLICFGLMRTAVVVVLVHSMTPAVADFCYVPLFD